MILPLGAFPMFQDLPRSGLSYVDVSLTLIVQALNFPGVHDTPFRKRASAGGGSLPQPTSLAGKRKTPRDAGLMPPRWNLTEAALVNPLLRLTSFAENLDLLNDWMEYLRYVPGETPD